MTQRVEYKLIPLLPLGSLWLPLSSETHPTVLVIPSVKYRLAGDLRQFVSLTLLKTLSSIFPSFMTLFILAHPSNTIISYSLFLCCFKNSYLLYLCWASSDLSFSFSFTARERGWSVVSHPPSLSSWPDTDWAQRGGLRKREVSLHLIPHGSWLLCLPANIYGPPDVLFSASILVIFSAEKRCCIQTETGKRGKQIWVRSHMFLYHMISTFKNKSDK